MCVIHVTIVLGDLCNNKELLDMWSFVHALLTTNAEVELTDRLSLNIKLTMLYIPAVPNYRVKPNHNVDICHIQCHTHLPE